MILTGKLIEPLLSTPNFNSKVTKFRAFLEESLNVVMALTVNNTLAILQLTVFIIPLLWPEIFSMINFFNDYRLKFVNFYA